MAKTHDSWDTLNQQLRTTFFAYSEALGVLGYVTPIQVRVDMLLQALGTCPAPTVAQQNLLREYRVVAKLYQNASALLKGKACQGPPVALFFSKMPSKRVYHNAKKIGDSMDVKLIALPGWQVNVVNDRVTLYTTPEKGISMEGGPQHRRLIQQHATFHDIRLRGGLRMHPAHFLVKAAVLCEHRHLPENAQRAFTLDTHTTQEFIVVSNTNQWGAAEGILLKKELFPTAQTRLTWNRFVQNLQREFVRQTRQRPSDALHAHAKANVLSEDTRKMHMALVYLSASEKHNEPLLQPDAFFHPLYPFDIRGLIEWCKQYIWAPNKKLALTPLDANDFKVFWAWFGKLVHHIRHNRTLRSLWLEGLIPTLLTSRMAKEIVARQPPGYFVLRFSTSKPNDLVVTYRRQNGSVTTTVVEDRPKHGSVDADAILLYLQRKPMLTHMFVQKLPTRRVEFVPKANVLKQHRLRKLVTTPHPNTNVKQELMLKRPDDYEVVFLP